MEKYLSFQEYVELGGTVSESAFPNLLKQAQRKLDNFTHDRIKKLTTIPAEVKELLTLYIDKISSGGKGDNLASYSNGTESFSYRDKTPEEVEQEYYRMAVVYLPIDLISQVVG